MQLHRMMHVLVLSDNEAAIATSPDAVLRLSIAELEQFLQHPPSQYLCCRDVPETLSAASRTCGGTSDLVGRLRELISEGRLFSLGIWQAFLLPQATSSSLGLPRREMNIFGEAAQAAALMNQLLHAERMASERDAISQATVRASRAAMALCQGGGFPVTFTADDRQDWCQEAEDRRHALEQVMDADLRRCFAQTDGSIRFRNGYPEVNQQRLHSWLTAEWQRVQRTSDFPHPAPEGTNPEEWSLAAQCAPQIGVWAEYEHACRLLRSLAVLPAHAAIKRLSWHTAPRLALRESWWGAVLGKRRLRPGSGHKFMVLNLPDLESRCLMAVCRQLFPEIVDVMPPSSMNWNRAMAGTLRLNESEGEQLMKVLFHGVGLRLGDAAIACLADNALQPASVRQNISGLRSQIATLLPLLAAYELRSLHEFLRKFDLNACQNENDCERMALLHATASDRNIRRLMDRLGNEMHFEARQRLSRLSSVARASDFADKLLAVPRESFTGRNHPSQRWNIQTAEFLDLADDIRKEILVELAGRGWPCLAWKHQVVALVPETAEDAATDDALHYIVSRITEAHLGNAAFVEIDWAEAW